MDISTRIATWRSVLFALLMCGIMFGAVAFVWELGQARNMQVIRDTLSTSVPGAFSNHRVEFRVDTEIPAGGFITITPDDGAFLVPTSTTFSYQNIELFVAAPSTTSYVARTTAPAPSATEDGVTIVTGTSGSVSFTLNSTTGIQANSSVRIVLGDNTSTASSTLETGLQNPSTPGTYSIYIEAGGLESANARAMVAIINQVGVGPIDTTETVPPVRFNGAPTGELSHTVTSVELSLETDELATCRFSTASGTPYFSMSYEFSGTGGVVHTEEED